MSQKDSPSRVLFCLFLKYLGRGTDEKGMLMVKRRCKVRTKSGSITQERALLRESVRCLQAWHHQAGGFPLCCHGLQVSQLWDFPPRSQSVARKRSQWKITCLLQLRSSTPSPEVKSSAARKLFPLRQHTEGLPASCGDQLPAG